MYPSTIVASIRKSSVSSSKIETKTYKRRESIKLSWIPLTWITLILVHFHMWWLYYYQHDLWNAFPLPLLFLLDFRESFCSVWLCVVDISKVSVVGSVWKNGVHKIEITPVYCFVTRLKLWVWSIQALGLYECYKWTCQRSSLTLNAFLRILLFILGFISWVVTFIQFVLV